MPQDAKPSTSNQKWGSDIVAETIRELGYRYIALVPGASFRGLHDSLVNHLGNRDPRMVVCLHEGHAVAIADGYSRATDEPMAVALHSNVGLMPASMSIFNAWCDRRPMLIIGATGPVDAHKRRPWIDWVHTSKDQGALIRDYIKWDDQPASVEAAVEAVLRADQITRTTPCGPVYICLDAEMQEAALDREVKIPPVARYRSAEAPAASADLVARVAKALRGAKFPVILAGRVSRRKADWERRVRLAEALGAAVLTTLHKGAAFPTEHPNHVLAPMGDKPSPDETKLLEKADVILSLDWHDLAGAISARSGKSQTQAPTAATVVHCSLDSYLANGWSMDHQALPAVDLGTGRTAVSLRAAGLHVCATLDDGSVKCWGGNDYGELGLGDTAARGDDPGEMGDNLPTVNLGAGRRVIQLAVGDAHNCALLDNDTVKCWGLNESGQLGLGDNNNRGDEAREMGDYLPAVATGSGRTPLQIGAGEGPTCVLFDDHAVKCWGAFVFGSDWLDAGVVGPDYWVGDGPGEMGGALPVMPI